MKSKLPLFIKKSAPLLLVALLFVGVGCDKEEELTALQTGPIQMRGANQVPAVATTGSGLATVSYNRQKKTISYTLNWVLGSGATTTLMHFHGSPTGSPEVTSPVVVGISGFEASNSGFLTGTTRELTESEEADFLAGKWYLNIHSNVYPSGELRGQVIFP